MLLWRVSNYATLDGRGGLLASARWHTQGRAIVYLAESPSGALIEVLVRLELDPTRLPQSYKLLKLEAPDDVAVKTLERKRLPRHWMEDEIVTRTIGDEWLAAASSALLRVPSAVVPETWNVLLNSQQEDARRLKVVWHKSYPWDRRLFE